MDEVSSLSYIKIALLLASCTAQTVLAILYFIFTRVCLLHATVDADSNIRFFLFDLQRLFMHVVCVTAISGPKVHGFTLVKVQGHVRLFRP